MIFLDHAEGMVLFVLLWKGTFLFVEICTSFYLLFGKTCVSDQLGRVLLFYPSKLDILRSCVWSCDDTNIVLTYLHLSNFAVFSLSGSGRHVKLYPFVYPYQHLMGHKYGTEDLDYI